MPSDGTSGHGRSLSPSRCSIAGPSASLQRPVLPCPRLTALDLTGCSSIGDGALLSIARNLTSVVSLRLNGCSITDHGIRELLITCRTLRKLHVADTRLTDAAFDQVWRLSAVSAWYRPSPLRATWCAYMAAYV